MKNCPRPYLQIDSTDEAEILTTRINDHGNPYVQSLIEIWDVGCYFDIFLVDLSWNAPPTSPV